MALGDSLMVTKRQLWEQDMKTEEEKKAVPRKVDRLWLYLLGGQLDITSFQRLLYSSSPSSPR